MLATEGQLPQALAGLEWWRGSSAVNVPGKFEGRVSGVCMAARDFDGTRAYYKRAIAASADKSLVRLDLALFEARLGSVDTAAMLLADEDQEALPEAMKMYVGLVDGLIACRSKAPTALALMTAVTTDMLDKIEKSPTAWSIFSYCCGWWAVALSQNGQDGQAVAAIALIKPLLVQRHNWELLVQLKEEGLLPGDMPLPAAPGSADGVVAAGLAIADHGAFRTVCVQGVHALKLVESYRRQFANGGGVYPFLIGDRSDLADLLQVISPPSDSGKASMSMAREIDPVAWFSGRAGKASAWPKECIPPIKVVLSQYEALSGKLKREIFVGLIALDDPCELFARLGYGDWNGCPAPHVHVALHQYWRTRYGAEPIALSASVVECCVALPPPEQQAALKLAREQNGYCDDLIEQGAGSVGKLASSLLNSSCWYFWWD